MSRYVVGDTIVLWTEWRALTLASLPAEVRALTDPTTIAVSIELPDATTTAPTPVKASTGVWYVSYATTQAGRHVVTWTGTGAAAGIEQQVLEVRALS